MKKEKFPSSNVPKDFDVSIYDICNSWTLKDWALEIEHRSFMANIFREAREQTIAEDILNSLKPQADMLIQQPLKNGRTNPNVYFSPIMDQSAEDFFMGHHVINNRRYKDWVASMQLADLYGDDIDGGDTSFSEEIYQSVHKFNSTPAWKVRRDACGADGYMDEKFFISVNLKATEEYLVKQFKEWINKTRKDAKVEKVARLIDEKDIHRWHNNRLLPYLDLAFWNLANRKIITYADMEGALFPNQTLSEGERIRKTVAPNALTLISKEFIYVLHVQLRSYEY